MKPHLILWNPIDGVSALNDYLILNRKEIYNAIEPNHLYEMANYILIKTNCTLLKVKAKQDAK